MADPSLLILPEDLQKQSHLLAFYDFCLDLFEEEFGKIPPEEKVDPRFVKGFLSENNVKHNIFCCLIS